MDLMELEVDGDAEDLDSALGSGIGSYVVHVRSVDFQRLGIEADRLGGNWCFRRRDLAIGSKLLICSFEGGGA